MGKTTTPTNETKTPTEEDSVPKFEFVAPISRAAANEYRAQKAMAKGGQR